MSLKTLAGRPLPLVAVGLFLSSLLAPAAAQGPALAMLGNLDKGQWEVRFRDGGQSRRVCLQSGQELLQLEHGPAACSRFVVDDGASEVTVQYTCRGNGYGRTTVRRETASLVQIDSNGIAGGMPFDFHAEARKVGTCR